MIVLGRLNGLVHEATVEFDPYSLEFFNDPFEIYRGLRDEAPVYHNEKRGFYALSRFQDVLDASVDFMKRAKEADRPFFVMETLSGPNTK